MKRLLLITLFFVSVAGCGFFDCEDDECCKSATSPDDQGGSCEVADNIRDLARKSFFPGGRFHNSAFTAVSFVLDSPGLSNNEMAFLVADASARYANGAVNPGILSSAYRTRADARSGTIVPIILDAGAPEAINIDCVVANYRYTSCSIRVRSLQAAQMYPYIKHAMMNVLGMLEQDVAPGLMNWTTLLHSSDLSAIEVAAYNGTRHCKPGDTLQ